MNVRNYTYIATLLLLVTSVTRASTGGGDWPTCNPDGSTVFGQNPDLGTGAQASLSEGFANRIAFEQFGGATGPIEGLTCWGIYVSPEFGGVPCVEDPAQLQITFFEDVGGLPGAPVYTQDMMLPPVPVGVVDIGGQPMDVFQFDIELFEPLEIAQGWVSVVGQGDPNCWFHWLGSYEGDGFSLVLEPSSGDWQETPFDLSVCLWGLPGQLDLTLFEPFCDGKDGKACGAKAVAATDSDPLNLATGEFVQRKQDLEIEGRGFNFTLTRTYRSRTGQSTLMGNNWAMSYDVWLQAVGPDLLLHSGDGRQDLFLASGPGSWGRPEYFRVIDLIGPDLVMTHADQTIEVFGPVPGTPPGVFKRLAIIDRNGNEMTFAYDPMGRLMEARDTLHVPVTNERVVTFAYNPDGFLAAVTDWTGRSVSYDYYADGDPEGAFGDLRSVTYPVVVNTPDYPVPAGHEWPAGKTITYTYTTGFADEALNHDLLTITDSRRNDPGDPTFGGAPYVENIYAHTTAPADTRYTVDPGNVNYDHVVAQFMGPDRFDYVYVDGLDPLLPEHNGAVMKVFVNNRAGDVKALFFDAGNRLVIRQEYTGRAADPLSLTDLDQGINPPVTPLRPGDPAVFETRHEWNADSLMTRVTYPNGNVTEYEYDEANPDPRSRGNRLIVRQLPGTHTPAGDQVLIEEAYEYDADFGGCCGDYPTAYTDGRGNRTEYDYDPQGNLIQIRYELPGIVEDFEFNPNGQMTAHVHPDNGSGHRRRDEYTYYGTSDGSQNGYNKDEIIDATGFALTTTHEYNRVGQVIRTVDPRGADTLYIVNQLDQVVVRTSRDVDGSGTRYATETFFDANDNVVRVDVDHKDEAGTLQANAAITSIFEYDELDGVIRKCAETGDFDVPDDQRVCVGLPDSEFVTVEYEYDSNHNQTRVRRGEATNGNQPDNVTLTLYDERDLVFLSIRAVGHADQSTSQYDYDGNRNLAGFRQGIEDSPRVTTFTYDGYDRVVSETDPMGNVQSYQYDANGNVVSERVDGELIDVAGSGGNVRLYEKDCVFDELDRMTSESIAFFDPATQTPLLDGLSSSTTVWSDASLPLSSTNDNGHTTQMTYDTANRKSTLIDAKGNAITWTYDANSNVIDVTSVELSDLAGPNQVFTTRYTYDGLDRRTQSSDNLNNTFAYGYDSRDNKTLTVDGLGRETRYEYDGLNRLVRTTHDTDDDGADPADEDDVITIQAWDDSSRLLWQSDDNDNITDFVWDPLGRQTRVVFADGTRNAYEYDVHNNFTRFEDANGSVSTLTYDDLDRLATKTIVPAPGVAADTTTESFSYDGLSRIVSAVNDGVTVTREYDSLSSVIAETINGATSRFAHDGVQNKLSCTYPGGRVVDWTYDELERMKTATDAGSPIATYDYVGMSRVERLTLGNGTRTDFTYDGITGVPNPAGDFGVKQITQKTHTRIGDGAVIDDRAFVWDSQYNKLSREDLRSGGPALKHQYQYDSLDRLTRTVVNNGGGDTLQDKTYRLDGVGNREDTTGGAMSGLYFMDAASPDPADFQMNQYTSTPGGRRVYDENGNLAAVGSAGDCNADGNLDLGDYTGPDGFAACMAGPNVAIGTGCGCFDLDGDLDVDFFDFALFQQGAGAGTTGGSQMAYDYRNRLVSHLDLDTGLRTTYAYDALDRRVVRVEDADGVSDGPSETRYFYDGWKVCEEQNGNGDTQATYVYGPFIDEVLSMQRGGTDYYFHADDLFSVTVLTDASGSSLERYEYGDYGAPTIVAAIQSADQDEVFDSDADAGPSDVVQLIADDFTFAGSATITGLRWWGGYAYDAGTPATDDFVIRIYADAGGVPGALLLEVAPGNDVSRAVTGQLVSSADGDVPEYAYATSITTPFAAAAGTQYWLSVVNDTTDHGSSWAWESTAEGNGELAFSHDGSPWQNFAADTAFELVTDRSAVGNPYLFTGRRYDPESGWYHCRTRYLDPDTGRFTTRDTIGIWGDEYNLGNGYTYVGSNPWTYLDPFGLKVEWKKGPGATDADMAKAKQQWADAKKRRNGDGTKPEGVKNMENLEDRKDKTITIVVGTGGNSYGPKGWKCAMDPKKGADGTINFNPNKKGKMSDGTERDPESSLVHEATHARHGADGKIAKTADGKVDRKAEEVKTTGVENEHRKAKGAPQRKKYGSWKVPQH